jgi:transposase
MSELCREFGVSRNCGQVLVRRYRDAGWDLDAAEERSRRPKTSPSAIDEKLQDLVVEARRAKPKWGPVKLRAWLAERNARVVLPSAVTIATILKRRGFVRPAKRRRRAGPTVGVTAPFPDCDAPNAVWWYPAREPRLPRRRPSCWLRGRCAAPGPRMSGPESFGSGTRAGSPRPSSRSATGFIQKRCAGGAGRSAARFAATC